MVVSGFFNVLVIQKFLCPIAPELGRIRFHWGKFGLPAANRECGTIWLRSGVLEVIFTLQLKPLSNTAIWLVNGAPFRSSAFYTQRSVSLNGNLTYIEWKNENKNLPKLPTKTDKKHQKRATKSTRNCRMCWSVSFRRLFLYLCLCVWLCVFNMPKSSWFWYNELDWHHTQ